MRNRAKCKLCQDVLESFHRHDLVTCKCGEISIDGGMDYLNCSARDWKNFLRVDDNGNEIIPKIVDEPNEKPETAEIPQKMTRKEQIDMLETMVKNIENLPKQAMDSPINHYDFYSYMLIMVSILKTPLDE